MNVVDSSAWLAYFADEENASEFEEAILESDLLLVPTIVSYEVFRVVLREKGESEAFQVGATMLQGRILALDLETSLEAASIGHREKLAMADSIIYAMAIKHDAVLWTQHDHFEGLPRVEFRRKQKS